MQVYAILQRMKAFYFTVLSCMLFSTGMNIINHFLTSLLSPLEQCQSGASFPMNLLLSKNYKHWSFRSVEAAPRAHVLHWRAMILNTGSVLCSCVTLDHSPKLSKTLLPIWKKYCYINVSVLSHATFVKIKWDSPRVARIRGRDTGRMLSKFWCYCC